MTTLIPRRLHSKWLLTRQKSPPPPPIKPNQEKQGVVRLSLWFLLNIFWTLRLLCLLAPCQMRRGGTREVVAAAQMTVCQSSPRLHCVAGELVGLQSICVYPNLNGLTTCKNKQRFPGRHIGSSRSSFVPTTTEELIISLSLGSQLSDCYKLVISKQPWWLQALETRWRTAIVQWSS